MIYYHYAELVHRQAEKYDTYDRDGRGHGLKDGEASGGRQTGDQEITG